MQEVLPLGSKVPWEWRNFKSGVEMVIVFFYIQIVKRLADSSDDCFTPCAVGQSMQHVSPGFVRRGAFSSAARG